MTRDTTLYNDKMMNVYIKILLFIYIIYILGKSDARVVHQNNDEGITESYHTNARSITQSTLYDPKHVWIKISQYLPCPF